MTEEETRVKYTIVADTDTGIVKETNQDSICVRVAEIGHTPVVMAMVCDGMGGLSKGELASATVVRVFSDWFLSHLPGQLNRLDWQGLSAHWVRIIGETNEKLLAYGRKNNTTLGTTVSGLLIIGDQFMSVHVGDSRIYRIGREVVQMTEDHTFVSLEIQHGRLTKEQAAKDPRRNILLQCVGASETVMPEVRYGTMEPNHTYMICTDGFRNELSLQELQLHLNPYSMDNKEKMRKNARYLIDIVKSRMEKDNITVILIRAEEG